MKRIVRWISVIGIGLIMFSCTPITGGPSIPDNDNTPEITEPTDVEDPVDVEDPEEPSGTEEPTEPTDVEEGNEEPTEVEEPAGAAIEDYLKFNTIELTDYDYLANVTSTNKSTYYQFGIPRATLTIETLDGQLLYENTTAFCGYRYMKNPVLAGYAFEFYCKEDSGSIYYTQRVRTTPEKTNELKITFKYQGDSQEKVIEVSVEDGTWKYIN